MRTKWWVCK